MLGVYKIKVQYMEPILVIVQNNIIGPDSASVDRLYDLKGSTEGRLSPESSNPLSVRKDLNFMASYEDKLVLDKPSEERLM
jgi:hypothetical protein